MSKLILGLLPLETRVNPAGVYTASLIGTTLTLTGTDDAESIVIRDDGVGMTITGQNGTLIGTSGSLPISGAVNSLRIIAKGGDDTIDLDQTVPLSLSGRLDIDLGTSTNGNTFNLSTPQAISLGSVRLFAGSGQDIVTFSGATASVTGNFIANLGNSIGEIFIQTGTTIGGNLSMTGGLGYSQLQLNGVTVNKNVVFNPGDGASDLQFSTSSIGGNVNLSAGRGDDTVTLDNTSIGGTAGLTVFGRSGKSSVLTTNLDVNLTRGGISITSADDTADLTVNVFLKTIGSVTMNGRTAVANANAPFQTRALTLNGRNSADFNGNGGSVSFGADVRILSRNGDASYSQNSGSLDASGRMIVSGVSANLYPNGSNITIGGDVSVLASTGQANFSRSASSQFSFDGNITVRGASADVNFSSGFGSVSKNITASALAANVNFNVNGTVTFVQNLTINGRNSPSSITLISNTASLSGNLTINTGDDADSITIGGFRVSGATSIRTAGGGDVVSIDNGSKFTGPTLIDTGAGDDFLEFARATGLFTTAVEFTGKATIRAGAGNDQLKLGRSNVTDSGDANSLASFGAGSTVDGGLNLNSFDDELGQTTGSPTILNWTDPTPP